MALFLREVALAIRHNEAHVTGAGLIDSRKVNLVQNAMTEREPNAAMLVQCGANTCFRARSPTRFDAWPSRRKFFGITQNSSSLCVEDNSYRVPCSGRILAAE